MTNRTRRAFPAIAASTLFIGASIASAAELTQQELLSQIEQLKSKVEAMESKQMNTADVDATVDSVLRDAERRSQLLAVDGVGGGYDAKSGFHLKDASGANTLRVGIQFQYRNVTNYLDEAPLSFDKTDGDEDLQNGMEIRRLKTTFSGSAISTALKYVFTIAYNRNGGSATLENAYINYAVDENWGFQVGQFKDMTFKEESTSSSRLLAVDRSLVNEQIGGGITDYIQAVAAYYKTDQLMFWLGLSDGINSDNTDFLDEPASRPDFGVILRADYALMGKQSNDFTAMGNSEDSLIIGAGGHWSQAPEENTFYHSVDVQYENTTGLSAFAAYYGQWADVDGDFDSYDWGVLGQVGQMLSEEFELFGQVGYMKLDLGSGTEEDSFLQFVAGMNYYLDGHTKVTIDVVVLPDGSPSNHSGIGVLASDELEVAIRGQFQLVR